MAQLSWEESYLGKIRKSMGDHKLINIGCRGIVMDEEGGILLVQRKDNNKWVMPAGSMELNESVFDGLKREVWEETGLKVQEAELIAIYSDPNKYSYESWGFEYQMLSFVFYVTQWAGTLESATEETIDARFFKHDELASIDIPPLYIETLQDLQKYKKTRKVIVN
ncbi:NUDIX domain-containing protein [Paenibacillus sp. J2TS4]|uniref:NUDIX domain-containing protein n=1 Tax=Paenibacillus sp. J2TS4 TaxID=2807194 RepID=UPI001B0D3189|nr:NUDIX domain-containing protein [Paenibacillus sp. J2TS4]GIP31681.1 DNA mismatch repair protein MutT [Paenibacillus sp. J2TS4]